MNENIKTKLGTPCAPAWPTEWIQQVEMAEAELGHRICGAIGPDVAPCPMPSDHPSGRCKYHGGSPHTGAQPGNTNSTKHGLYSRSLRICGSHCPKRHTCPCYDERLLEFPKTKWPTCPYEQEEYDNLTRSLLPQGQDHSPLYEHMVHSTALLSVMTSRAAAVLSTYTLVEVTKVRFENYTMDSNKVSACLSAFLRLSSEHTKCARELAKLTIQDTKSKARTQDLPKETAVSCDGMTGSAKSKTRGRGAVEKVQPKKLSKKGTDPSEASPRAKTGLSLFLRPQSEKTQQPATNNEQSNEDQREGRAPARPQPPAANHQQNANEPVKLECTFSTAATKIKKSKSNKRRKKKRKKTKPR